MDPYQPEFTITSEMFLLAEKISENLGKLSTLSVSIKRKEEARIRNIQASLAIEGHCLSLRQVKDLANGKDVPGRQADILAVKNAIKCYEKCKGLDPFDVESLLKEHGIMMEGLVKAPGEFRQSNVGVVDAKGIVLHLAPPPKFVPELIQKLFDWLQSTDTPMLIRASVFHYEFEFIHPFIDGNGRMDRLWQTVLLQNWKPVYACLPIETTIKERQQEYYKAIHPSTKEGSANPFILFILHCIKGATEKQIEETKTGRDQEEIYRAKLLQVMDYYLQTSNEIMKRLHLKSRQSFVKNDLKPAMEDGAIAMTEPDKPNSRFQMYVRKD